MIADWRTAAAAMMLLTAAACVNTGEQDAVRDTAASFYGALAHHQWQAACDLLAPATRQAMGDSCRQSLSSLDIGSPAIGHVDVWGDAARVSAAGDVAFLVRAGGWRIDAAGCRPTESGRPYDCSVER